MKILVKGGQVVDPAQGISAVCDVIIESKQIRQVVPVEGPLKKRQTESRPESRPDEDGMKVIDARGMLVIPGLVDLHVHLREPGFEYKETIKTGTEAAVHGGFTSVCCMPNTNPVNDEAGITKFIIKRAMDEGACTVYPIGSITKGQRGEELSEMGLIVEAGAVAFSDDGKPVMNSLIMRRALEYSRTFGVPIIAHCEDLSLSGGGMMNEGLLSVTMGLRGIPTQAEEIMVARDIMLAELTKGRLHIAHVSSAGSVDLIRAAKKRGLAAITAETCPHYFSLTERAVAGYNTNAKVSPPLRKERDIEAMKEALADGTIDVIATDHAPHHRDEKFGEFDDAPPGISGLETAWGLSVRLVEQGFLTISQLVEKMAATPARIIGVNKGALRPGAVADLTIIDPEREYQVDAANFLSKGKNTPFDGWTLKSLPVTTIAKGRIFSWG